MEKYFLKSALIFSFVLPFLISAGCGRVTKSDEIKVGVEEASTWGSVQEKPNGEYIGTGGIRFLKTISSSQVSLGTDLGGALDEADSSIELVMFAKNPNLSDGVHLKLNRSGPQLVGTIEINNTGTNPILERRLDSLSPAPLDLTVDFHAQGSSVRVMIYQGNAVAGTPFFFDSKRAGDLRNGTLANSNLDGGIHGGVLMIKGRISKAQRRESVTPRENAL